MDRKAVIEASVKGLFIVCLAPMLRPMPEATLRIGELARRAGALGAKLTGGGGGGCMIALAHDQTASERIAAALSSAGYVAFVVEVTP